MKFDFLKRELEVSPDDIPLLMAVGEAHEGRSEAAEALACFERVIRLEPGHPGAAVGIARLARVAGRTSEAEVRAEMICDSHPEFAPAWILRARLALDECDQQQAHEWYNKAVELDLYANDMDLLAAILAEEGNLRPAWIKGLAEAYLEGTAGPGHRTQLELKMIGERAIPYLLAAFEREDPFKVKVGSDFCSSSPAKQAMAHLHDCYTPELKRRLLYWIETRGHECEVRAVIAEHFIRFGSDDLLAPITKLVNDYDYDPLLALSRAAARDALEPKMRAFGWEYALRKLYGRASDHRMVITFLKEIDPVATVAVLSDHRLLDPDHPLIVETLEALTSMGSPPALDVLTGILERATQSKNPRVSRIRYAVIDSLIAWGDPD